MPSVDELETSPTLLRGLGEPSLREQAWRIFLERYRPLILCWCQRAQLTHDDTEEISSIILARLVTTMPTFVYDPARRFRAWLQTVVMNEVRTLWRERQRRPYNQGTGHPDLRDQLEEVESPACMDELEKELVQTLGRDLEKADQVAARVRARVVEHTWQAYWQTVIEGEKARTVAERLGIKVTSVYQAKTRIGKMLREEGALFQSQAEQGGTGQP
jgi:RNA polymerase sigma factor (sigma-70 family)